MTEDELVFAARLASLNQRLGRYVVRLVDEADPRCTTEYTAPLAEVEAALSSDLRELAEVILGKSKGEPRDRPGVHRAGARTGRD